jgi:RimJ/RimL family protein N-acetyltransferase
MADEIRLRRATLGDMESIFELSNEEVVRQQSINSNSIEWADHQKWFLEKITDGSCEFYLVETLEGRFVGQVRIEERDENVISISISKEFRGKRLAATILEKASSMSKFQPITAYIKKDNQASLKSFEHAGYTCLGERTKGCLSYWVLTYECK